MQSFALLASCAIPMVIGASPEADRFCEEAAGLSGSHCEWNQNPPVCQGSKTVCSVEAISRWLGVPSAKAMGTPDPCLMSDAVLMGRSPISGDNYYMQLPTLRACMQNTTITHANAIWTLHNLHYGVAETYSFTDMVTDISKSVESNLCNYKLHQVSVDLKGDISSQLAAYNERFSTMSTEKVNEYLNQERPAYRFHSDLLRMMNKLHDGHTLYSTPYDMFRVYFPVTFGSKMVADQQVITLRYSTDSSQPLGRLAYVYKRLFGKIPLRPQYAGAAISRINNLPALDFLKSLVADDGVLANSYQQLEQRLNAFIFHAELLVLGQLLSPLPDFDELVIEFQDGHVESVKLVGQFSDLYTSPYFNTPNLRSTAALSIYLHSNAAFGAFLAHEKNLEEKKPTLWKYATASASNSHIRIHGLLRAGIASAPSLHISRKHKALLDPVKNLMRDHLLNLPSQGVETDVELEAAPIQFEDAETLTLAITEALRFPTLSWHSAAAIPTFTELGGMSYAFIKDTVVVKIPSMAPEPRFDGDEDFHFFPDFVEVQKEAKKKGIRRVLFDVTDNGGGYVKSAYALLWYTMADSTKICAPLRKRITSNWQQWIDSFGIGLNGLVDKYLVPQGVGLVDKIDAIFAEITSLVNVLYDGFGFTNDDLGGISKSVALRRVNAAKASVNAKTTALAKAVALITYIKSRNWVPRETKVKNQVLPDYGFCPFDPEEMIMLESRRRYFTPSLSNYKNAETKNWGTTAANYSQPGKYAVCFDVMQEMPLKSTGYEAGYWKEIAFVSDGTCGSACALFTQGIQTNGDAVAFTYGGVANSPLDVASFAGGNVEDYDSFWPGLAFGAKVASLASNGLAPYTVAHENSWVSSPIAFPTRAKARFNWNMMFVEAMGDNALPRQFYLIPGRRHFNVWGSDEKTRADLYAQITGISDWAAVPGQFVSTHGQCPLEATPFASRQKSIVF